MGAVGSTIEPLERAAGRVLEAMAGPWDDALLDRLALEVYAQQRACIPAYDAWCEHELGSRGGTEVGSWRDVPALPIAAFKRLRVAPDGPSAAEWWSSGTTAEVTSRHHVRDLALYEASLAFGVRCALLPDGVGLRAVQLAPPGANAPNSSLSHMLDAVRGMCDDGGTWVGNDWQLDADGAWAALEQAAEVQQPVLVLATSFALVQLLDAGERVELPVGSRVMDTGGYKGRTHELTREELVHQVGEQLGVPATMCENEYGMSELSSQAWLGSVAASVGHPLPVEPPARWQPPWFRTRVVDPATLDDVADGEQGLLVHHDLANAWSCAAIRTEDWGVRRGDSYELLGRAPGAELRGCSLQLEDVL